MRFLAILTFYGEAALVLIGGPAYFFRIGRVGVVQVGIWYRRMPPPQLSSDDYKNTVGVATGIPTSLPDWLLSFTPIGWLKTFGSAFTLLKRSGGMAFVGGIIGGLFGRLWYMMILPLFALGAVLRLEGVHYSWPQWLTGLGVTPTIIVFYIIGTSFVAFFIGRKIGSQQRSYNTACLTYSRIVARRGYWFNKRNDADHYRECVDSLEGALRGLDRSLNRIGDTPTSDLDRWQAGAIQYQRSLVLATLSRYDEALKALEEARRLTESLKGSPLWDTDVNEEQVMESQLLFLKGELLVIFGDREGARALFEQSRSIDLGLGDLPDVELNEERLTAISATSPSPDRAATTRGHYGPATPGNRRSMSRSQSAVVNADHGPPQGQSEPAQPALHVNASQPIPTASTARRTPRIRQAARRAATNQLVKALDERIIAFIGSSDAAAVLDEGALRDARDLSSILARPAADEPQADLRALCVLAWMHWCRSQALPQGLDRDDFQTSVRYFSQILPVMPDAVPSFVRQDLAQASTPTGQVADQEISIKREYWRSRRLCRLDTRRYVSIHGSGVWGT